MTSNGQHVGLAGVAFGECIVGGYFRHSFVSVNIFHNYQHRRRNTFIPACKCLHRNKAKGNYVWIPSVILTSKTHQPCSPALCKIWRNINWTTTYQFIASCAECVLSKENVRKHLTVRRESKHHTAYSS
jgi:hypothetical protein